MKTLRLTKPESAAYAAGERCFWRQWRVSMNHAINHPQVGPRQLHHLCRYGKSGDRIIVNFGPVAFENLSITAITVTQRDGKWGWVVEVGA